MSTPASAAVVVPVRNGERYLEELLEAVARERPDELVVVDSGSTDRSPAIARAAGAERIAIAPEEFGHGSTRNMAAERTSADLICFLTQDATPVPGWLDAYRQVFALDERVGAAFGPHLPRPETSPMIARELEEFFHGFSPTGEPALQRSGDEPFLSNVNACYARACWEEIRFPDVAYAEDQAFGRVLLERGWAKVYQPRAAVLHAHDYGALEFMRRYFDEYRGLRETTGHVEPFALRAALREVRALTARDRAWMAEHGIEGRERARWTRRALVHHAGRKLSSSLGSRSDRLPPGAQRALSLEGRGDAAPRAVAPAASASDMPPPSGVPSGFRQPRTQPSHALQAVADLMAHGAVPLLDPVPGMADRERLHVAVVVPPFQVGSGGHNTIFQVVARLERMGHTCSIWLHDPTGIQQSEWPALIRRTIVERFAPVGAPVFKGFDHWYGADVAMATGWQTVYPTALLPGCRARAYFVNDHEPEFYAASPDAHFAEASYRLGMHCIAASPWLRDLLVERYGVTASDFQLGVDHDVYTPRPVERRRDTVLVYARQVTPRRAVPLATLALQELLRRRPGLRVVLYGDRHPPYTTFDYEFLGVVEPERLAWLYSEATVGLCLSMTNFSLIPKEMLACGLPCVELAGVSAESIFGPDGGPLELAPLDPFAIADAVERLLDDRDLWERRSRKGIELVSSHTWDVAAEQTEAGLREALRLREAQAGGVAQMATGAR